MNNNTLINFLKGALIGIVDSVPGISGGTVAVVVGIYDRLIASISIFASRKPIKDKIKAGLFLLPIVGGLLVGLFFSSVVLSFLLEHYEEQVVFFFIGLILGSLHFIIKKSQQGTTKIKYYHYLVVLLLVLMFFSFTFSQAGVSNKIIPYTGANFWLYIMMGVIGSSIMIIPGISGSFVLMLLGYYKTFVNIVATLQIVPLAMFGIGAVIGFVIVSKIINALFVKYYTEFYFIVIGLVASSMIPIFPYFTPGFVGVMSLITFFVGFSLALFFGQDAKEKQTKSYKRTKYIILTVVGIICIFLAGVLMTKKQMKTPKTFAKDFLVVAHRGGNTTTVEATKEAYQNANQFADVLEMDAQLTKDNKIVLFHDDTTERLTGEKKTIRDYTYDELLKIDFGKGYRQDTNIPYKMTDKHIMLLEDVLKTYPDKPMIIELKMSPFEQMDQFCALLDKYNRWGNTVVASFISPPLAEVKRRHPEAITAGSEAESLNFYLHAIFGMTMFYQPTYEFLILSMTHPDPDHGFPIIKPNVIKAAQKLGVKILAWTINDYDRTKYAMDNGLGGVITDDPKQAREFYNKIKSEKELKN